MQYPVYHDPLRPEREEVERYHLPVRRGECEARRPYTIYIMRREIVYDVEAQLHVVARSRRDPGLRADHGLEGTGDIRPLLDRWTGKHVALVKSRMSAYLAVPHDLGAVDTIEAPEEERVELLMPSWWDGGMLGMLKEAVHDYVVNAVLAEYLGLSLTMKDSVALQKREQAEEAMTRIKDIANTYRAGTMRKRQHPFT